MFEDPVLNWGFAIGASYLLMSGVLILFWLARNIREGRTEPELLPMPKPIKWFTLPLWGFMLFAALIIGYLIPPIRGLMARNNIAPWGKG